MGSGYRIAVIPGDGIGQEVTPAAMRVLDVVARRAGLSISRAEHPWGCDYYREKRAA